MKNIENKSSRTILPKQHNSSNLREILIVTGCSGAGKTSVIRCLEDLGFYCIDNLPLPLLQSFSHLVFNARNNLPKVALGIDIRGQQFFHDFILEVDRLKRQNAQDLILKIIFLNASNKTLVRRFQETRRNHPLTGKNTSLISAIKKEKKLLEPIMAMSEIVLDTDEFNIHALRNWVFSSFEYAAKQEILVNLISFGFKYGIPTESNMVYDLRSLPNPYFVPELKLINGTNKKIVNYLFAKKDVSNFFERLTSFLRYALLKSYKEGRFFVNVAIGCTGGKHRSVAFVEKISQQKWENIKFLVHHRDLGKE